MEQSGKSYLPAGAAHSNIHPNKFIGDREFTKSSQHGGKRIRKNNFRKNLRRYKSDSDETFCSSSSTHEAGAPKLSRAQSHDPRPPSTNSVNIPRDVDTEYRGNLVKAGKNFRTPAQPQRNSCTFVGQNSPELSNPLEEYQPKALGPENCGSNIDDVTCIPPTRNLCIPVEQQRNNPELSNPLVVYQPKLLEPEKCGSSMGNLTYGLPQMNHAIPVEQQRNNFECSNPQAEYQPENGCSNLGNQTFGLQQNYSEFSGLYVNYQFKWMEPENGCRNHGNKTEVSIPPTPNQIREINVMNIQENFPEPPCCEQTCTEPAGYYPAQCQCIPISFFPQAANHLQSFFHDSNRNLWNHSFTNPKLQHVFKPFPPNMYPYPMPGTLNGSWSVPYYTRGGLLVNPQALFGTLYVN